MIKAVIFDMYETLITHFESPLYFCAQMALDAGIEEHRFRALWEPTEHDRTTGKLTFEAALETVLRKSGRYSEELFDRMVQKRIQTKEECFNHLHEEIIPLFRSLKENGTLIGLISNCFSEEAAVIRKSVLFPYFDAVCLSYEQGLKKPDTRIYERCLEKFHTFTNKCLCAEECLYVGDGGSFELEAAEKIGIRAVQAVWYLRDGIGQPVGRKAGFLQMEPPRQVWDEIRKIR